MTITMLSLYFLTKSYEYHVFIPSNCLVLWLQIVKINNDFFISKVLLANNGKRAANLGFKLMCIQACHARQMMQ